MRTELIEQLTMQFPNMTLSALLLLSGISCTCFTIIMILLTKKHRRLCGDTNQTSEEPKHSLILMILIYFMILYTGIILLASINLANNMKMHGCGNPITYEKPIAQIWKSIYTSPKEDVFPESTDQALIIYYRFGCHDCELLYHTLQEQVKGIPNVYWIATRSEQGIRLREQYPITGVPSGVAIKNDRTRTRILYRKQKKEIRLDVQNLTELTDFTKKGS